MNAPQKFSSSSAMGSGEIPHLSRTKRARLLIPRHGDSEQKPELVKPNRGVKPRFPSSRETGNNWPSKRGKEGHKRSERKGITENDEGSCRGL